MITQYTVYASCFLLLVEVRPRASQRTLDRAQAGPQPNRVTREDFNARAARVRVAVEEDSVLPATPLRSKSKRTGSAWRDEDSVLPLFTWQML